MMQQQHEQPVLTDQTPLITPGFVEPSTFAHQRDFPLLDTPYSDLQVEAHRVEEEVPQVEGEEASQEEEEADSQVEGDLCKAILMEDHQETDL